MIVPQQSAKTLTTPDLTIFLPDRVLWPDQFIAETLVVSLSMIMDDELLNGTSQLLLAEEDHLVWSQNSAVTEMQRRQ